MRPATKHWLLLVLLAVTLAAMAAVVFWQISRARSGTVRTRPADPPAVPGAYDPTPAATPQTGS
jgi:hypothetical protein